MITKTFTMPTKRDYKAEYKKFQSSTKSKKYRAELNQYNRKKGTYGNGDGKDASHKGGKIVGFEKESVNRGRAEKSRLKKEANMPDFNPMIDKALDEVIEEYTMSRKGVIDKIATLAKANRYGTVDGTQMNGKSAKEIIAIYNHPKMKKFKKAMADYTVDDFVNLSIKLKKVLGIKVEAKVNINKKEMDKLHKGDKIEKDGTEIIYKEEDLNEAGMELKKLEDAIKFFKKKIEKQGRVTNARDEEHLERLMKVYNDMGGRKIKENNELFEWLQEACWKGYEKKGMKTMFGKQYPNCVKKKKSESVNEVSDKQKRKIYKKAFGKEYDDPKRKQAPLPLDIAYKVALNRLKKKEGVNEAFAIQYKKDKRYLTRKELFDKKPLKFKTEDEAKSMLNGLDYKYRTNYKIVKIKEGLGDRMSKVSKKYAKGQKKSKKALKNKKGPYQEEMNETPYELGGMKVYSKSDGLKKVKSMQKTDGAKIYKVTKTKTKLYDKYPVTMYNLHTKNKNHSTNSNPYGLDMMRGVYLIPVKESVKEGVDKFKKLPGKVVAKRMMSIKSLKPYASMIAKKKSVSTIDLERELPYDKVSVKDIDKVMKESVNEGLDKRQAGETLKQLGGNKFIAMTGAKNFTIGKEGLAFKIGRNAKAVNYVVIQLNGKDLYDMKFQKGTRVLKTANDVYGDQLQKMFTKHTGMYTSLGTMGR